VREGLGRIGMWVWQRGANDTCRRAAETAQAIRVVVPASKPVTNDQPVDGRLDVRRGRPQICISSPIPYPPSPPHRPVPSSSRSNPDGGDVSSRRAAAQPLREGRVRVNGAGGLHHRSDEDHERIESESGCRSEVTAQNAQPVEIRQVLFRVDPHG